MHETQFSRLINKLISKVTLILCGIALYAGGIVTEGIVMPVTAQAIALQSANIPQACTEIDPSSIGAAGRSDLFWKGKNTIQVRFLDGSSSLRTQVRYYARQWSKYANIRFVFVESGPSDIRVSFNPDGSSWSYIGTSAKNVNQNEPTMNFGWFVEGITTDEEFRRTILHEFGHVLGLIHEHQSPRGAINWNKLVVYNYYWKHFKWTEHEVNENIFKKYEGRRIQYTDYDPSSIMHYPIPASFTINNRGVVWNTNLSQMDIAFIGKMYPPSP